MNWPSEMRQALETPAAPGNGEKGSCRRCGRYGRSSGAGRVCERAGSIPVNTFSVGCCKGLCNGPGVCDD